MVQDTSGCDSPLHAGRQLSIASSKPSHLLEVGCLEVEGAVDEGLMLRRDETLDYVADMAESLAAMLATMSHDVDSREIAALLRLAGDRARKEVSAT
jgi:hypothetical protein